MAETIGEYKFEWLPDLEKLAAALESAKAMIAKAGGEVGQPGIGMPGGSMAGVPAGGVGTSGQAAMATAMANAKAGPVQAVVQGLVAGSAQQAVSQAKAASGFSTKQGPHGFSEAWVAQALSASGATAEQIASVVGHGPAPAAGTLAAMAARVSALTGLGPAPGAETIGVGRGSSAGWTGYMANRALLDPLGAREFPSSASIPRAMRGEGLEPGRGEAFGGVPITPEEAASGGGGRGGAGGRGFRAFLGLGPGGPRLYGMLRGGLTSPAAIGVGAVLGAGFIGNKIMQSSIQNMEDYERMQLQGAPPWELEGARRLRDWGEENEAWSSPVKWSMRWAETGMSGARRMLLGLTGASPSELRAMTDETRRGLHGHEVIKDETIAKGTAAALNQLKWQNRRPMTTRHAYGVATMGDIYSPLEAEIAEKTLAVLHAGNLPAQGEIAPIGGGYYRPARPAETDEEHIARLSLAGQAEVREAQRKQTMYARQIAASVANLR